MDYIYGKLNLEVKKVEYSGVDTTTARTTVVTSDEANEISVDVLVVAYTTELRPTVSVVGTQIFDTTIGKPIWWNGTAWVDAAGTTV